MPIPIQDIINAIRSAKPYLREHTVESFINRKISEELQFQSLSHVSGDIYRVSCSKKNIILPLIRFKVDICEQPEFKSMDMDEEIHIEGKISYIDEITIELSGVRVNNKNNQQENKSTTNINNSIVNFGSGNQNIDDSEINLSVGVQKIETATRDHSKKNDWHEKPVGALVLTVLAGLVISALSKYFGFI